MRYLIFLSFGLLGLTLVHCSDNLEDLIDEIFQPPKYNENENENENENGNGNGNGHKNQCQNQNQNENVGESENFEQSGSTEASCSCVPYFRCQDNDIETNGGPIIDINGGGPCPNYLEVCCANPFKEEKETSSSTPFKSECGVRKPWGLGFRITGNKNGESQFGEFPWMVAVLKQEIFEDKELNVYQCGGALIHPEVVLTAAHCVNHPENSYKIRVGEWDTQTTHEIYPTQDAKVKTIVFHPDFYPGALHNDVALLFLEAPVTLAENVDVICLPEQNQTFDYSKCFASGWGKDVFGKEGRYQVILKKVELPIVPRDQCESTLRQTRLGAYFNLHSSFICAGGEEGEDTCRGDGGSPLVCPIPNTNKYVHAGMVAWGIGCNSHDIPGVYVNVPLFRDWIDKQIVDYGLETKYYEY